MGLRDEKKARLRAQLYETGMALFAERGFDETRVRDIYEAVGVSEATFFNYFPSKESLLEQSAAAARTGYGLYVTHLVARADEPVADRVHELLQVVGSIFVAQRDLMSAVLGHTNLLFGSTGASKDADLATFHQLAELFRQGQRSGEIDPRIGSFQLAEILTSVMLQTITNWIEDWWGVGELGPRLAAATDVVLFGCVGSAQRTDEVQHPSAGGLGDR